MRMMQAEIHRIGSMAEDELFDVAKQLQVPYEFQVNRHDTNT